MTDDPAGARAHTLVAHTGLHCEGWFYCYSCSHCDAHLSVNTPLKNNLCPLHHTENKND